LLTACSAVVLASCGGDEQRTEAPPTIPSDIAEPLAERSEKVASLLDSGDNCAAAEEAAKLEAEVIAAQQRDDMPALYLEDLGSVAHELVAQIPPCEPPPEEEKKDKKDKGDGDGDD
jgi:hypothetical protein